MFDSLIKGTDPFLPFLKSLTHGPDLGISIIWEILNTGVWAPGEEVPAKGQKRIN